MKEDKFLDKIEELNRWNNLNFSGGDTETIVEIPIYFYIDDNGDVVIDKESMIKEFNDKLNKVEEILK